jgi:aspartyl-tRNA(Asn)/glutamyl-tRNA(Gln) amidotransferase subunit A
LGRDARDVALMMDVITGYDPKDSTSVNFDKPCYADAAENTDIKGMKIGYPVNFFGEGLDPEINICLQEAKKVYESLGAEFVEIELSTIEYALPAYYIIAPSEASSNLARYDGARYGLRVEGCSDVVEMYKKSRRKGFGKEVIRRIMTGTYALSSGYYDAYYLKAQKVRTLIKQDFEKALEKCDVIFTPTTPAPAFKLGEKANDPISMYLSDIYTVSVNLAGLPAISIPCGFTNGLPAGLQLIGRAFDESTLIRTSAAFQGVTDFHGKLSM